LTCAVQAAVNVYRSR